MCDVVASCACVQAKKNYVGLFFSVSLRVCMTVKAAREFVPLSFSFFFFPLLSAVVASLRGENFLYC